MSALGDGLVCTEGALDMSKPMTRHFTLDGVDVIAEVVTEGNLRIAQTFSADCEVGDIVVTYPDRRVVVMKESEFNGVAHE